MSYHPSEQTMLLQGDRKPQPEHHALLAQNQEARTLLTACLLTFFFFLVELVGGYIAHSIAIMSDAAHLLSDLAGFLISVMAIFVARLPANSKMSFGFARAEVLGAFISILFIWTLTIALVIFAIYRFFNPEPVNGRLMLALGCIGLAVNLALGLVIGHADDDDDDDDDCLAVMDSAQRDVADTVARSSELADVEVATANGYASIQNHSDGEQQSPSHSSPGFFSTLLFGNAQSSVILQAAYLHILGDALQNVGVIVAAIILIVQPAWTFVDPICTLFFAAIVIMTSNKLARQTFHVLMEGTPSSIRLDDIYNDLLLIHGVTRVEHLHVWSITTKQTALSVHLYIDSDVTSHQVLKQAEDLVTTRFNILHKTVQINCDQANKLHNGTQQNGISYDQR